MAFLRPGLQINPSAFAVRDPGHFAGPGGAFEVRKHDDGEFESFGPVNRHHPYVIPVIARKLDLRLLRVFVRRKMPLQKMGELIHPALAAAPESERDVQELEKVGHPPLPVKRREKKLVRLRRLKNLGHDIARAHPAPHSVKLPDLRRRGVHLP